MNVGQRIRQLRVAAGVSQAVLARVIGAKQETVSKWETGKVDGGPTVLQFVKLCDLLGCGLGDFRDCGEEFDLAAEVVPVLVGGKKAGKVKKEGPKRGRGRPKKELPEGYVPPPKGKAGRPRIHHELYEDEEEVEEDTALEPRSARGGVPDSVPVIAEVRGSELVVISGLPEPDPEPVAVETPQAASVTVEEAEPPTEQVELPIVDSGAELKEELVVENDLVSVEEKVDSVGETGGGVESPSWLGYDFG